MMEKEIQTTSNNGSNGNSDKKTTKESFKEFTKKTSPYIKRLQSYRWKILRINIIIAVVALLTLLLLVKPYFESYVVILPDYGSSTSSFGTLSSLTSLAGINIGEGTPTAIYENLVRSEVVLQDVIYKEYYTEEFEKPVNLIEYFEFEPDESLEPQQVERDLFLQAYEELNESRIKTNLDKMTNILTLTIKMPESRLSAEIANSVVESLDNYIRNKRKSYASEQRKYIEKRINQVKDSLTTTENQLKVFREKNRIVEQSPSLMLEQARMQRNLEIGQVVFIELTKQLEIAKIDEIKDTPVVNFREEAGDPVIKAGPRRALIFIIIMFFSMGITVTYYSGKDEVKTYWGMFKESIKK